MKTAKFKDFYIYTCEKKERCFSTVQNGMLQQNKLQLNASIRMKSLWACKGTDVDLLIKKTLVTLRFYFIFFIVLC